MLPQDRHVGVMRRAVAPVQGIDSNRHKMPGSACMACTCTMSSPQVHDDQHTCHNLLKVPKVNWIKR